MFRAGLIISVFLIITGYSFFSATKPADIPEQIIKQRLLLQIDSLFADIHNLQSAINGKATQTELQQVFLHTRLSYKKIEWAAEYFTPNISRFVNGPPVPEVELSGQVFDPRGLQVIEGELYPKYNLKYRKQLIAQTKQLADDVADIKTYFKKIDLYNWQVFDAIKLEMFRIITLGIAGFDDPLSENSMGESATSVINLKDVMANYTQNKNDYGLNSALTAAANYLQKNTAFNNFNPALFITRYGNPVTISLTKLQQHSNLPVVKYNRLLNQSASTLFDKDAFNVNAYAPSPEYFVTDKRIALGKKLFADPVLSGTASRSCASCHKPNMAFTDGLVKNIDITGKGTIARNTPTLLNAALQPALFYDLRAASLEDQALAVVQSKTEMHGDMKISATKLWQDKQYRELFTAAYPNKSRTAIDTLEVMNALGSYIRSLITLNSRFDQYMQGNEKAMNRTELNGFNLFMGKARCGTCHYMPLFNGTFPPKFNRIEAEVIGVPKSKTDKSIDPDMGLYAIQPLPHYKYAFKTTTVRNAAQTAPYMHNGVFTTLEEVIDFYNKGGGAGEGIRVNNQTLTATPLHLTEKEKKELIAFIKALDSK